MDKVNAGIEDLLAKHPGMPEVKVSHGLRGIRYYLEFPINGKNVDAFRILSATQQKLEKGKDKFGVRVTGTDSY
jgi:hypothetical protein